MSIIILLFCLPILLAGCGGGGTESSSAPDGINTGIPTVVKLLPVQFIAQTNSFITLRARVLDGNGNAVPNYPVSFTNLSLTGVLTAVTANTNNSGNAEVRISSTTPGFATILAQVTGGSGTVRDRKTIFFSTNDILTTTMSLDVNSVPGNGIYNENSDFILFESDVDDTVEVLATVYDAGGVRVGGGWGVSWGTSHAEAGFVRAETETNVNGQAKAVVKVTPTTIRDTETHVNVSAFSQNGSFNLTTLFLRPVVVAAATSSLTAKPTTVAPNGTSELTAIVKLTTGALAPDGTTVSFTATCGTVTPFSQLADGIATGTFTAPDTAGACTVTATAGGVVIGSVVITVAAPTTPLVVTPSAQSISCTNVLGVDYIITGGTPAYTVTSLNPGVTTAVTATGFHADVTGGCGAFGGASTAVSILVQDSSTPVASQTVTLTVTNP